MKKTISLILALVLISALLPLASSAAYSETVYDIVYTAIMKSESSIDVNRFNISPDDAAEILGRIIYTCPEAFHLGTSFSFTRYMSYYIKTIRPVYVLSGTELSKARSFYESELDRICSYIPSGISDAQKALFLHDYICVNYEYDLDYKSSSAYSVLKTGKGVCMAYSLLYDALLERVGIDSSPVFSESLNHMWNEIKIDGKYYHVDVTWDDPVDDTFGLACHDFFLLSDSAIGKTEHGSDFDSGYAASSSLYDGHAWHGSETPFGFVGTKSYYLDNGHIYSVVLTSGKKSEIASLDGGWTHSGLGSYGKYLVCNSRKSIMLLDPSTGNRFEVAVGESASGSIYSCYAVGSSAKYIISSDGDLTVKNNIFSVTLIPENEKRGDVDGNGKIETTDYLLVKRSVLGTFSLSVEQKVRADIDSDGRIAASDYLMLKRHVLGTYTIAA